MNRFITPIKREFWEFRGTFVWLPAIVATLIALLMTGALALYASGVINYVLDDDDFNVFSNQHHMHSDREMLITKRDALREARVDIAQARGELVNRFTEEFAVDINRELEAAQKELDAQGIDITIKRHDIDIDHTAIQVEVRHQLDRELARIDHEIGKIDALLARSELPSVPVAPAAPVAPSAPAAAPAPGQPAEIRTFPETVTVIEQTEGLGFTDENIKSINDVVKGFFAVFSGLMLLVSIFYLLSCLHTDRKDNSILFWKSMPVSELQQVLTKLGVGIAVLPGIAVLSALLVAMVFVVLTMFYVAGYSSSTTPWEILSGVDVFSVAIRHFVTALSVALWCLPFFAWLLLASAASKRSPFFLALLPPLALILVEEMVFDSQILLGQIILRLPTLVVDDSGYSGYLRFAESGAIAEMLVAPGLWGGLVVGAGLIIAATWLRNQRYEI